MQFLEEQYMQMMNQDMMSKSFTFLIVFRLTIRADEGLRDVKYGCRRSDDDVAASYQLFPASLREAQPLKRDEFTLGLISYDS